MRWNGAERKQSIIDELAAEGLLLDSLADEVGKDLDPFDLIRCYDERAKYTGAQVRHPEALYAPPDPGKAR